MTKTIIFSLISLIATVTLAQNKRYLGTYYNAHITLDRAHDSLSGVVTMHANSNGTKPILQHRRFITIDSVFYNNARTTYTLLDSISGSYLVQPVQPIRDDFILTTYFHGPGRPEDNPQKWGGVTDNDSIMFAMGVGFSVPYTGCTRHWLPCYDLPDRKADSVDLTFTVPADEFVASNGLLVSNTLANGMRTLHWHESKPIATYLLTFATSRLVHISAPNALHIPFDAYAERRDSLATATLINTHVRQALEFYDSLYGKYPFEKVGYVVTPIGSMEHQTMISLSKFALDTTQDNTNAIHELSHQWWGDWVTCKTFDDAWLNEGFATFTESLFLERFFGTNAYWKRQHNNVAAAIGGSIYPLFGAATADGHTNNYPYATIYQKGAAVLGYLRYYLGDSLFFGAIRYYGSSHAYGSVTSADLEQSLESYTGQPLAWFFHEWVYSAGYPTLALDWQRHGKNVTLNVRQTQDLSKAPLFFIPAAVEARSKSGAKERQWIRVDSMRNSSVSMQFSVAPDTLIFDPDNVIVKRIASVSNVSSASPLAGSLNLSIHPNPSESRAFTFEISGNKTGELNIALYDTGGRFVQNLYRGMKSSKNVLLTKDVHSVAAGSYFAVATIGGDTISERIVILR